MAFNPAPSNWLGAGYTVDTGSHTISMTTVTAGSDIVLEQLTDAKADETTGDIRDVAMSITEALFQSYLAQASPDRPSKMILAKSTTGGGDGISLYTYTFKFYVEPETFVPASE